MITVFQKSTLPAILALLVSFQFSCKTNHQESAPNKTPQAKLTGTDSDFIGMKIEAAQSLAKERGLTTRISEINGKAQSLTEDYSQSRINFDIQSGKVIKSTRW